jgi:hypothetical protein
LKNFWIVFVEHIRESQNESSLRVNLTNFVLRIYSIRINSITLIMILIDSIGIMFLKLFSKKFRIFFEIHLVSVLFFASTNLFIINGNAISHSDTLIKNKNLKIKLEST